MPKCQILNTRKGFALTEVLLAIAVIIIIGVSAYPLYANSKRSSMVEEAANDMAVIQSGVEKLYTGQGGYRNLSIATIQDVGIIPEKMQLPDGAGGSGYLIFPWGGPTSGKLAVLPITSGIIPDYSGFVIGIQDMPLDVCTQLIQELLLCL